MLESCFKNVNTKVKVMNSAQSKSMSPGKKFFFSRILPLIFVVVGAIVLFVGARGIIRARSSLSWPTTQGKIVESSVEHNRSSGSNGGNSTTYEAEILYEFTVEGMTFSGSRIAYGDYGSSNPSHARRVVNRYPKDKKVTVHYMPVNPEECLLEPGLKIQALFLPGFGLIFFTAGCLMVVFGTKATKKAQRHQGQSDQVEIQNDFGAIDTTGSGASLMKTEVKLSLRDGIRLLQVTMTYGVGGDKRWQTFNWQIDGNQLKDVSADLQRVIQMVEDGEGKRVRGRWILRLIGHFQQLHLLSDLGPVSFHDGQDRANGLAGELFGKRCFMYEVVEAGSAEIQPFPLSSLRAILGVLETL